MKETIYTIPINDAFDADCECPICEFLKQEEKQRIEYCLGSSMMEPDERIKSNERGYCQRHTQMMYEFGNKLSHALILETRLKYLVDVVAEYKNGLKRPQRTFLGSSKRATNAPLANSKTCVVCERLDVILDAFTANIFYLYKKDEEFKNKFFSSKGFCLPHFELLINESEKHLNAEQRFDFLNKLCDLQTDNLNRVLDDVVWFTKKFDYRYKNEDWKNSKDAVIRGSSKISSYIEEE